MVSLSKALKKYASNELKRRLERDVRFCGVTRSKPVRLQVFAQDICAHCCMRTFPIIYFAKVIAPRISKVPSTSNTYLSKYATPQITYKA